MDATHIVIGSQANASHARSALPDAPVIKRAVETIPGCDHFSMIAHGLFKASVFDFFDGWLE